MDDKKVPVYADGKNVRDWLYVEDNCAGIDMVLRNGQIGEVYNIGGGTELTNIELTRAILGIMHKPESLIEYVKDRPGHDKRYGLDSSKLRALGWSPRYNFQEALENTVEWYKNNEKWWRNLKSVKSNQ